MNKTSSQTAEERDVVVTRHGYQKSGVVLYLARCRTRKDLREYVGSVLPSSQRWSDEEIPFAYSIVLIEPAMNAIIGEACDGLILACHMVVVWDELGGVTPEAEGRSWTHEVGHLGYFFGSWGYPRMCSLLGFSEPSEADKSEAAAYMSEYATECVQHDIFNSPGEISSGLPFILPWMEETDEQ